MNYTEVVSNAQVYGLEESIKRAKYPMAVNTEALNSEVTNGIKKLAQCAKGTGHDQFLTGIIVQFDLTFTVKAWTEAERYNFLDFISSQSTMHRITKFDLDKAYISAEEWLMYARGEIDPNPAAEPLPLLKKGDRNEYVRHWQMFLNLNGYNCGNADGIFGPKTEAAVRKWQKDHKDKDGHPLVADGIIGPKTWASLGLQ